jgi:hypothetical protein
MLIKKSLPPELKDNGKVRLDNEWRPTAPSKK